MKNKFRGIFHYDLDGVVSDIILSQVVPIGEKSFGGYHRFDGFIENVPQGADVIVADCCFNVNQFAMLKQKAGKIIYIDHHTDSVEIKDTFVNDLVIFDTSKAGAGLCLDFVQKRRKLNPMLVQLAKGANAYDLFKIEEDPEWFKFGYNLNILFWDYHYRGFFERFKGGFDGFNRNEVQIIKDYKKQRDKDILASTYVTLDGDQVAGVFCIPKEYSINNDIPRFVDGYDIYYIMMAYKNSVSISVRSKTVDLTKYLYFCENHPEVQSAGGHPQAAGITFLGKPRDETIVQVISELHAEINKVEARK